MAPIRLLSELDVKRREEPTVSGQLKEFHRESRAKLVALFIPEERLNGLTVEERLPGLTAEEILRALAQEVRDKSRPAG